MKKKLSLMIIFLSIATCVMASEYDVPADKLHESSPSNSLVPLSSVSSGGSVLWDLTHGVYLDYEPSAVGAGIG